MPLTITLPTSFWCDLCRRYMPLAQNVAPASGLSCAACGEEFTCGDCGHTIEPDGDCERRRTGQHR